MSDNKCPECGADILSNLSFCSGCGMQFSASGKTGSPGRKSQITGWLLILGFLVVFGGSYFIFFQKPGEAETGSARYSATPETSGKMVDYAEAAANLPDDYGELVNLGNNFMDNRDYHLAVISYEGAIAIDSSSPDVLTDLGACYHALGNSEAALKVFEQAIGLAPEHAVAHFNMGIVYHGLNDLEKTKYYWNKLVELHPELPLADTVRDYIKQLGL